MVKKDAAPDVRDIEDPRASRSHRETVLSAEQPQLHQRPADEAALRIADFTQANAGRPGAPTTDRSSTERQKTARRRKRWSGSTPAELRARA